MHNVYYSCGMVVSMLRLMLTRIIDRLFPPKADSVIIVAHPDDETLFFYKYIIENHPYVVVLSDGWSLRRMREFRKANRLYHIRYRVFNLMTREVNEKAITDIVEEVLKIKRFTIVLTHNSVGEYGHPMHRSVHNAVLNKVGSNSVWVPNLHGAAVLSPSDIEGKKRVFTDCYKTQRFVLDMYTYWVEHEEVVRCENDRN